MKKIEFSDKEFDKAIKGMRIGLYKSYILPMLMMFMIGLSLGLGNWDAGKLLGVGAGVALTTFMMICDTKLNADACRDLSILLATRLAKVIIEQEMNAEPSKKAKAPRKRSKSVKRQKNV